MKISFVINEPINRASGGYKTVYMYANVLAENGDDVTVFYRCKKEVLFSNYKMPFPIKLFIAKVCARRGPKWYSLNKKVQRKIVTDITDDAISDGDVVIATAADTADAVMKLSDAKGQKFYFIQGYEKWVMSEEQLKQTYAHDMNKIVVAKWLKELVEKYSEKKAVYIPNGINQDVFCIRKPVEERNPHQIAMMYHDLESKGSLDGIKVLLNLKKRYPDLEAHLFGIVAKPADLPEWVMYTYCAGENELVSIYNNASVYLCPSWEEGFGLTGAEAMLCGCALVSTSTQGVLEYADHTTALLVEPHDTDSLEKACIKLFDDSCFRIQLAKNGNSYVSEVLDLQKSTMLFLKSIYQEDGQYEEDCHR